MNFASLQTKPSFTKQRVLPTYFDAEQLGFTPKDKDVGYLTAIHERSFREALAARAYIRALMDGKAADDKPLVITSWASAKELPAREGPHTVGSDHYRAVDFCFFCCSNRSGRLLFPGLWFGLSLWCQRFLPEAFAFHGNGQRPYKPGNVRRDAVQHPRCDGIRPRCELRIAA
jgi:hypothetical protein